jgi:hypothetical protein
MKARALALMAVAGGLLAQSGIQPPLAGFIHDSAGLLRPVYGMAGNFILGKPIVRRAIAMKALTSLHLADGTSVYAEGGDLVFRKAGGAETRTTLGEEVLAIERMGEVWIHVSQAGRHSAARLVEDRIEVYRLPEAAQ